MRTTIEYMQFCHIHLYQKIARKKVARVNAALERKFLKDSTLKEKYVEVISGYLTKVHAKQIANHTQESNID